MSLDKDIIDWLEEHEHTSYINGESTVCGDPDGGLLRYSKAIRQALAVHKPVPWYEECRKHEVPDEGSPQDEVFWNDHQWVGPDADVLVCEDSRQPDACSGCTPDGADDDTVMSVRFPCPTVKAIAEGLGLPVGGSDA